MTDNQHTPVKTLKDRRPSPPNFLDNDEKVIWKCIVSAMDPEYFGTDTQPLLIQYCRHVATCNRLENDIRNLLDTEDYRTQDYKRLLDMRRAEGNAMATLATRLRLSHQARYDKKVPRTADNPSFPPPWEYK